MSSNPHAHAHGNHDHDHQHGGLGHGGTHGSFRGYVTGFLLAAILTAIPFWLVMGNVLENKTATGVLIILFAAVQIVVHMIYFLHMNSRAEGGWTLMALIFTVVIIFIAVSGSLWIMYHLNANMMPMTREMMKNMP